MRKQHAEHNEKACLLLEKNGNFDDWVITTAFYSALHYVQYELFPLVRGAKTFPDFENYYASISFQNRKSKHKETIDLVQLEIQAVGSMYRWLHDASRTARYKNYFVSKEKSERAVSNLQKIKNACAR